ncbi:hypothetical protein AG0111_0g11758 [Alternaria gaisen]|uniref:Uncharacterized protein n=2 Tax=Alternaria gaisen TaxID=167740 RepID=A0ACB6F6X6_9PLEO|nr:hypothetical protein AG0111_0g11749 [Alternaria gaisen]KAB2100135.1 hypothetical protein AG0111_0g11758 [Alternaria gaisen]
MGSSSPDYLQLRSLAEKQRPSVSLLKKQFWIPIQCHKPRADNNSTRTNFLWIRAKSKATIRKVHKAYESIYPGNTILLLGGAALEATRCIGKLDNFRDRMIVLVAIPVEDDDSIVDNSIVLDHSSSPCTKFISTQTGTGTRGGALQEYGPFRCSVEGPATNFMDTYVATVQLCLRATPEQGTIEEPAMQTSQIHSSTDSAKGMHEDVDSTPRPSGHVQISTKHTSRSSKILDGHILDARCQREKKSGKLPIGSWTPSDFGSVGRLRRAPMLPRRSPRKLRRVNYCEKLIGKG